MRNNHKLFLLVLLLMMTGCNRNHKCVVRNVLKNMISATDIKTGDNKIFILDSRHYEHFAYLYPGDDFLYCDNGHYKDYEQGIIVLPQDGHLLTDCDSLTARQHREWLQQTGRN